jgi:enoyl-CoA hydratase/carnithine racemase
MSMGLLDEIYDDAVLAAERSLHHFSAIARLSIAGAKYILNGLSMGAGALDLTTAQHLIDAASDSDDFKEGRRAFAEKASAISRRVKMGERKRKPALEGERDEACQV